MSYDSWKTTEPDPVSTKIRPVEDEEFDEPEDDGLSDVEDDEEEEIETEID